MTETLFVNYRTQDQALVAALLDSELCRAFGPGVVFFAARSIPPGDEWLTTMTDRVRSAAVLLAIIGPRWLTATDEHGRRCLDDPADDVRMEIRTALSHNVRVIPVRVQDVPRVDAADLPQDIVELASKQDITLHHRRVGYDIPHLIAKLRQHLPALRTASPDAPLTGKFSVTAHTVEKLWQTDNLTITGDWNVS